MFSVVSQSSKGQSHFLSPRVRTFVTCPLTHQPTRQPQFSPPPPSAAPCGPAFPKCQPFSDPHHAAPLLKVPLSHLPRRPYLLILLNFPQTSRTSTHHSTRITHMENLFCNPLPHLSVSLVELCSSGYFFLHYKLCIYNLSSQQCQ